MTDRGETNPGKGGACEAFAVYVDLLGAERAVAALDALEAALRSVFLMRQPADEAAIRALAGEAHSLVSTATAVGFLPVARACRDFEESCASGPALAAFAHARDVADAALPEIGRIRMKLQAAPADDGNAGCNGRMRTRA
jgi:hypothetical protein